MRGLQAIPRSIWALGLVSMFMDISSEMIHSLLPVFLVSVLGSSASFVGLIEGVAEATALITRAFSGALSDRICKRKSLALAGYTLGTLTKPLFALASGVGLVFTARLLDRLGKGIRGAPRDALVADLTPPEVRGAAYGLRQSLDSVGAFLGPLLAIILMSATGGNFRSVFWIAIVPGLLAVAILDFGVTEPVGATPQSSSHPLRCGDIRRLGTPFWLVVALGGMFTLARFSEAFLILRAESVGMAVNSVPAILLLMNVIYALTAYPVGRLSDRFGRTGLLAAGLGTLIASDLILAFAATGWQTLAAAGLWGLHLGLTQGLLSALVADTAPESIRGTAFGVFSMCSGIALLAASFIAGLLWDFYGAPVTFFTGATFAALALLGFMMLRRRLTVA
ncbi:MFS transporter [Thermodesulfobacteriota bacterium]